MAKKAVSTQSSETDVVKSPGFDLTPTLELPTISNMPAGLSVTKEQLERDLVRLDREIRESEEQIGSLTAKIETLRQQRQIVNGAMELYFHGASEAARTPSNTSLDNFSIAEACEEILKELENRWLSLSDLDVELRRHGKVCSKGSIELMLKREPEKFEIMKQGKRNVYKLKL